MRRQYHIRKTEQGVLLWDVHRLVELSASIPPKDVALSVIRELDELFWFKDNTVPTVRAVADHAKLIEETDLSYPIILSADGGVMDGMHRVAKAYLMGRETILAVQFKDDPPPDHVDVDIDTLPYDEPW